jgi:hypothetical protein
VVRWCGEATVAPSRRRVGNGWGRRWWSRRGAEEEEELSLERERSQGGVVDVVRRRAITLSRDRVIQLFCALFSYNGVPLQHTAGGDMLTARDFILQKHLKNICFFANCLHI